ncbi:prephenate dehydrogenase [Planctomicrobium sp. SH661]|uniref:prephenate dehydrogenase n=1 Tax=Planctomicrobium sp. SH661 TaxID=3448124 RepID=UPI003F5B565C
MSNPQHQFETVAIIGVGMIGGSVAAAAKARSVAQTVIGYGRNADRLKAAQAQEIIDAVATAPDQIAHADLIVVCTPVNQIADDVCTVLAAASESTLFTDAGSVKGTIQQQVLANSAAASRYVGAHPLAGSHLTGFEHADPKLFEDRLCILTPATHNPAPAVERVRDFWQAIGMRTSEMTAEEHDRILAMTSHLPHLAAAAVASIVDQNLLPYAASGYRDTTRVAAGDAELWTAIFSQNANQLAKAVDQFIVVLQQFRNGLVLGREAEMQAFLKIAQDLRMQYRDGRQNSD